MFRSGAQGPEKIHITGLSSRAMFCNDLKEKYEKRIIIKGVDAETMHTLLVYTYTSKALITKQNVQRVLEAANLFQVCDQTLSILFEMNKSRELSETCLGWLPDLYLRFAHACMHSCGCTHVRTRASTHTRTRTRTRTRTQRDRPTEREIHVYKDR
jgi:endonuclease III-like uncharacterized protein